MWERAIQNFPVFTNEIDGLDIEKGVLKEISTTIQMQSQLMMTSCLTTDYSRISIKNRFQLIVTLLKRWQEPLKDLQCVTTSVFSMHNH